MSQNVIKIKGTREGLIIHLDSRRSFNDLKEGLNERITTSKGFFKGAKFTFEHIPEGLSAKEQKELEAICHRNGLIPVKDSVKRPHKNLPQTQKKMVTPEQLLAESCTLVTRSLRSGQNVTCPNHLVVMGDVNPGAQVSSAGSVFILGTLRGNVHAGIFGDEKAVIIACSMLEGQLRIASLPFYEIKHYSQHKQAVIARAVSGRLKLDTYHSSLYKKYF